MVFGNSKGRNPFEMSWIETRGLLSIETAVACCVGGGDEVQWNPALRPLFCDPNQLKAQSFP